MKRFMIRGLATAAAVAATLAGGALAQSPVTAAGNPVRAAHGGYWQTGDAPPQERRDARAAPVTYSAAVRFGFDDDTLSGEARRELDALAQKLAAMEIEKVVAVGHSDGVGSPPYNRRLSARRAKAVGDYLAGKGVAVERLQLVAMGSRDPLTSGACETVAAEGRSEAKLLACLEPDRRVEVELVGREAAGR